MTNETYKEVLSSLFSKLKALCIFVATAFLICIFSINSIVLPDNEFDAYLARGHLTHFVKGHSLYKEALVKSQATEEEKLVIQVCKLNSSNTLKKTEQQLKDCQSAIDKINEPGSELRGLSRRIESALVGVSELNRVKSSLNISGNELFLFDEYDTTLDELRRKYYEKLTVSFGGLAINTAVFFSNFPILLFVCLALGLSHILTLNRVFKESEDVNLQYLLFYKEPIGWLVILFGLIAINVTTFLVFAWPFGLFELLTNTFTTVFSYLSIGCSLFIFWYLCILRGKFLGQTS